MLLAGRIGGCGRNGGRGRGFSGTSASASRLGLKAAGDAAARWRSKVEDNLPIRFRTSMGSSQCPPPPVTYHLTPVGRI